MPSLAARGCARGVGSTVTVTMTVTVTVTMTSCSDPAGTRVCCWPSGVSSALQGQAGSEGREIPPHPCSSWSSRGLQHCPPALRLPSCFSNQTAPLIALKPSFWSCCTLKRGESGVWLGFPCTLQADLENGNSKPYRSPQFWLGFGSCFCSSVGMSTLQRWIAPGQEGCKRRDTSQT